MINMYAHVFKCIIYVNKGTSRNITVLVGCPAPNVISTAHSISVKALYLTVLVRLTLRLDLDPVKTVCLCSILTYSK